ncbi:MAG: hypothetical protein IJS22_05065 [Lachnospiraceae bacterium]|nr:hypothetical protein [Lachnospiraceae bacterium]
MKVRKLLHYLLEVIILIFVAVIEVRLLIFLFIEPSHTVLVTDLPDYSYSSPANNYQFLSSVQMSRTEKETDIVMKKNSLLYPGKDLEIVIDSNKKVSISRIIKDNSRWITKTQEGEKIQIGDRYYYIRKPTKYDYPRLYVSDSSGRESSVDDVSTRACMAIFPVPEGIIIFGTSNITPQPIALYYINSSGETDVIFSCGDKSVASFSINERYAFISLRRYRYTPISLVRWQRYEDDDISGTYRISLEDFSVTKISEQVYEGMYIFDNEGVYACDEETNIWYFNNDGSELRAIIKTEVCICNGYGTISHSGNGTPKITRAIADWLERNGWKLPK